MNRSASISAFVAVIAVLLAAGGCREDARDAWRRSQAHLERAAEILEEHRGDQAAALAALEAYRKEHRQELLRLRREGAEKLAELPAEERAAFEAEARAEAQRLMGRIFNAARAYPNPREIMTKIQDFR